MIDRGKRSKTLNEVKPVGNISKNLPKSLEIRPMQKEVLSNKWKTMHIRDGILLD